MIATSRMQIHCAGRISISTLTREMWRVFDFLHETDVGSCSMRSFVRILGDVLRVWSR